MGTSPSEIKNFESLQEGKTLQNTLVTGCNEPSQGEAGHDRLHWGRVGFRKVLF
jgi:hypothetical protein